MRLILQILLILLIVSTVSICVTKPNLHKNIIVYDSAYTLVTEDEVKTETKDIPIMEVEIKPVEKTTVVEKKVEPTVTTTKKQPTNVEKQTVTKPKQTTTVKQTVTKPQTQTITKPVITTVQKPAVKETVKIEAPKVEKIQTAVVTSPSQVAKKENISPMTQQEETIAWNIWRSNLINQIMQDVKMPTIPQGTVFQFSFTVDKYGKITNIQTGANPANYTPYAIQYITPVIRSYQGRSILNFPEGTARTTTQVTGKWRMSTTKKYSTPEDFNDIEKVVR